MAGVKKFYLNPALGRANSKFLAIPDCFPKLHCFIDVFKRVKRWHLFFFGFLIQKMLGINQKMFGKIFGRRRRKNFSSEAVFIKFRQTTGVVYMSVSNQNRVNDFRIIGKRLEIVTLAKTRTLKKPAID